MKTLKTALLLWVVIYGAFAFYLWELNPEKWGEYNRAFFALIGSIILVVYLGSINDAGLLTKKERPEK